MADLVQQALDIEYRFHQRPLVNIKIGHASGNVNIKFDPLCTLRNDVIGHLDIRHFSIGLWKIVSGAERIERAENRLSGNGAVRGGHGKR